MEISHTFNKLILENGGFINEDENATLEFDELIFNYQYYGKRTPEIEEVISKLEGEHKWLFLQLLDMMDEFRENNVQTQDLLNTANWGLKPSGDLAMFDIGFGKVNDDYEDSIEIMEATEEDIAEYTKMARYISEKLGFGDVKYLGAGSFGFAFEGPDNKVLKITKDKSEYINSKKIEGKNLKHAAIIYATYRYGGHYVILLEKLDTSKRNELDSALGEVWDWFEDTRNQHLDYKLIPMIKHKNSIAGAFIEDLYKTKPGGEEQVWDKWSSKLSPEDSIDWNEVAEIPEWLKGSNLNTHNYREKPPQHVLSTVAKLLY